MSGVPAASPSPGEPSESFRLHYVHGTRRYVVGYDTLEAALDGAWKPLKKDRSARAWITDEAKHTLLDAQQVRALFEQRAQRRQGGTG